MDMKKDFLNISEISWCYKCYKGQICTFTNLKIAQEFTQNAASWGKKDIFKKSEQLR